MAAAKWNPAPYLQLHIGCMFASKTSRLMWLINRYTTAGISFVVLKSSMDTRHKILDEIASHDARVYKGALLVPDGDLSDTVFMDGVAANPDIQVILIDEGQFFMPNLVPFVFAAVRHNKRVHVSGLSGTWNGVMWPNIAALIPFADRVEHLTAVCRRCGSDNACTSHRLADSETSTVLIGGADKYEPLCLPCYLSAAHV